MFSFPLCLIKFELDFNVIILKTVYFLIWIFCKGALRISYYEKQMRNNQNFRVRKTTLLFTFLIRLRFQG